MASRHSTPPRVTPGPTCTVSSTPIRASNSLRTQSSTKSVTKDWTSRAIHTELKGAMIEDVPGLVESVFPSESVPLNLREAMAAVRKDGLYNRRRWTDWSSLPKSRKGDRDSAVCDLLNQIVDVAARKCRRTASSSIPRRKWTGYSATEPCQSIPDGVLLPHDVPPSTVQRRHACAFLEMKFRKESKGGSKSSVKLKENARLTFGAQYDRRFILGLTLVGISMRLWRFDRSGVLQSRQFNIHTDPERLLRVLCGFAFADPVTLGYDPTFTEPDSTGFRSVHVCGKKYKIRDVLHIDDTLRGRGTIILKVRSDDDQTAIIKDSWIDVSRSEKECDILKTEKAKKTEGIVHMDDYERVQVDGVIDSTAIIRCKVDAAPKKVQKKKKKGRKPEIREHYRLILREHGVSLTHFATRRELLSVLIDAIEAHRRMRKDCHVLHRDISFHNILISEFENLAPGLRRGRLIDFDYSKTLTESTGNEGEDKNHRSGTLPFMAVQLLIYNSAIEHKVHHDLQSFFYVLCWACIVLEGPGQNRRRFDPMKTKLKVWMVGDDEETIGLNKSGQMRSDIAFEKLLEDFHPYFEELKPTVRELRRVFRVDEWEKPDYDPPDYDDILTILKARRDALPLVEVPVPKARSNRRRRAPEGLAAGVIPRGQKRSRQEAEEESGEQNAEDKDDEGEDEDEDEDEQSDEEQSDGEQIDDEEEDEEDDDDDDEEEDDGLSESSSGSGRDHDSDEDFKPAVRTKRRRHY
ncbi:hypothetical protein PUNSTDRAFT_130341 [Punctularia strigosozonata HHB-11173 SS5]|uniref:uncharacterized protein n=1 Tax=Punctularia strigosozonata (strain HHB-11173) TaxID=741275 RepID=UPI0004417FED|nr:uncharacterized protein PUNSTDRAFT_130341 [Punctularia strigosozonata HHB-11173 SS5]EIN14714.1 hypothetical protein PUNSTDRAFT_130341 [Punctularia strigosozonata HHB-11173 SS5]